MIPEEFKAIAPTPIAVAESTTPATATMFNVLFIAKVFVTLGYNRQ